MDEYASSTVEKLEKLVADCIPDMEARVEGLRILWPGADVQTALNRNEALLRRMKSAVACDIESSVSAPNESGLRQ